MKKVDTLFLVDDDDTYAFLMRKVIEKTHMVNHIQTFENGKEALSFLNDHIHEPGALPSVILLDLTMPVMDGWEFLDAYSRLAPRLQKKSALYVVSSSIAPVDVQKAKSINVVSDYLVKPLTQKKMEQLLLHLP